MGKLWQSLRNKQYSIFVNYSLISCRFASMKSEGNCKNNILDPINLNETKFYKLLIANRGEIACRIISTAKKMGIKTVAVYSIVDAQSKHVKLADEAVLIGGPKVADSYINTTKILEAVKKTNADALHPGYGFLSENASFVELLEKENIAFIGPSSKSITRMGDKLESKRLAKKAGVNTIPGFDGIIKDVEHCVEIAKDIGYPVMIKASAGGGGMGMRIARNDKDAREGFQQAAHEALSSFADNRIIVEKYIGNPRHLEIQVLGDKYGNAVHFYERECSIQRRHQKVIEEAPSTFLDEETRKNMGKQAVALCKKIGYYSAGTVEFLIDKNRNFYFLEMNTRLQVEHPVTECITGIDLVQQMLRVAKGHTLNIKQSDIKINGWAIESRVYAENSFKNFGLPSTGKLYKYCEPENIPGVRCDSGIQEGSEISIYYDALLSKLICHDLSREEAIKKSILALDSYVIRGVDHNIPLLRDILTEVRFNRGDIGTNYLTEIYGAKFQIKDLQPREKINLLSVSAALYAVWEVRNRKFLNALNMRTHTKSTQGEWELVIELLGRKYFLEIEKYNEDNIIVEIDNTRIAVKNNFNLAEPIINADINGERIVMQLLSKHPSGEFQIIYKGAPYTLFVITKAARDLYHYIKEKPKKDYTKQIQSPMPGLIKSVKCTVGDFVVIGQELCVIEAMKMQNSMSSARRGTVKHVHVKEGDSVGIDDILIEID